MKYYKEIATQTKKEVSPIWNLLNFYEENVPHDKLLDYYTYPRAPIGVEVPLQDFYLVKFRDIYLVKFIKKVSY